MIRPPPLTAGGVVQPTAPGPENLPGDPPCIPASRCFLESPTARAVLRRRATLPGEPPAAHPLHPYQNEVLQTQESLNCLTVPEHRCEEFRSRAHGRNQQKPF